MTTGTNPKYAIALKGATVYQEQKKPKKKPDLKIVTGGKQLN